MIKLFNADSRFPVFLLPVFVVLLWINAFTSEILPKSETAMEMPLYSLVTYLLGGHYYLSLGVTLLFIIIQVFLLGQLNVRFRLIEQISYFPAFLFLLLVSIDISNHTINPLVFANVGIILSFLLLFDTYKKNNAIDLLFQTFLILSTTSLFYLGVLYWIPVFFIAILILRTLNWREWVVSFLGIIPPYIFAFTYYFYFDRLPQFLSILKYNLGQSNNISFEISPFYIVFFSFLAIILVISIIFGFTTAIKKIAVRKYYYILLYFIILGIILIIIFPSQIFSYLCLLSFPITYFISNFLIVTRNRRVATLIIVLFILFYVVGLMTYS
ncbi:MAG: hypothetical protein SNJ71_02835 [Bacteroidales bacterium]